MTRSFHNPPKASPTFETQTFYRSTFRPAQSAGLCYMQQIYPYVTAMFREREKERERWGFVPTNSARSEKKKRGVVPRTTRDPPELSNKRQMIAKRLH